jgi:enoyl-CoA hydratase/carnithine racemase
MVFSSAECSSLSQTFAYIKVKNENHLLTITLARPQAKNAMSPTMIREYAYAMSHAHYNKDIWAVVFEAEGTVWCAGADLKAMRGEEETNDSTVPHPKTEVVIGDLFTQLHKPVIAKIHAPVYAGGFLLVGNAHYSIAVEEATFSLPEVKRGIFPFQVMAVLLNNMPARTVLDWCMRAKTLTAKEALDAGLLTNIVKNETELHQKTAEIVAEIFQNSPSAIRLGLKAYTEMQAISAHEKQTFLKNILAETIQTQDAQEGLKAFAEKRKAVWKNE